MKRALSLIIVLAMVLCMIPFSAFAADFNVGADFVEGNIALNAANNFEASYLWTATEEGTLEIFADAVQPEEGESPVIPYILVDGAEYTGAIAVLPGQSFEITIGDDSGIGGEVYAYTLFKGLPGTESNPHKIYAPMSPMFPAPTTNPIAAGETVHYDLIGYAGQEVIISGAGIMVVCGEETYGGNGEDSVSFTVAANGMYCPIVITNKSDAEQIYTVTTVLKVGTMDNPEVVPTTGEYQANLEAGNQGYYYTYIAEGNGTVSVTAYAQDAEGNTLGTLMFVHNLTASVYGDNTTEGYWSVDVAEGDEIVIMVSTYNAEDQYNAPAGTVTAVINFEAASEGEEEIEYIEWGSVLGGETTKTNETDAEIYYTYTAEQDGGLYRSDYGFIMMVSAGDPVNICVWPGETVELYYASPVAMIGETEYFFLDEAIAAAVAGDTIVLMADAVSEYEGIVLKPGIKMELGAYTLTAPYVMAFDAVTGVVGSAAIVADSVMLNNVIISDVEYEWVGTDGVYTLVEYKAPVVGTEEPIVAEFGGEQMGLSAAIVAAGAVATADAPATVTLICDATVDFNVVIEPNVILNIGKYTLTAPNVIGLNGSMINAAHGAKLDAHGKIVVPTKDNMALSDKVHVGNKDNSYLLPIWNESYYLFTQVRTRTDKINKPDDVTVIIQQRWYWDDTAAKALLADGLVADNGLKVVVKADWLYGALQVEQRYFMNETDTTKAVTGSTYGGSCDLTGLTEYHIQGQLVTDCGAIVYWTNHTVETPAIAE